MLSSVRALCVNARGHTNRFLAVTRRLSTTTNTSGTSRPALSLYNSVSKQYEEFKPRSVNEVTWYQCGPTVYDHAHVGHARNYISFDIVRRVLTSHFGYRITTAMGITDIDDKIVNRAAEVGMEPLELARKYEDLFHRDMAALNVQPPHVYTRVSDHIPEITSFIERLVSNENAYQSKDSPNVFFDTGAFGDKYRKLVPGSKDTVSSIDPSVASAKRDSRDFALWKAVKDDCAWPSPWGKGRPGWHIECSAMTHAVFGEYLDIHSGGIDLAFPHHANEIAQSEACFGHDWATTWLHAGHLHIEGRKMSKSLKNFITIDDVLRDDPAGASRQLRIFCLMHPYRGTCEFNDESLQLASEFDKKLDRFFYEIDSRSGANSQSTRLNDTSRELLATLTATEVAVDSALAHNVNTPECLKAVSHLIHETNIAMAAADIPPSLLHNIRGYITSLLSMFGVEYDLGARGTAAAGSRQLDASDPLLNAFLEFRGEVRQAALTDPKSPVAQSILKACDTARDGTLPAMGVEVTDRRDDYSFRMV